MAKEKLKEWYVNYVKHRDIISKKIDSINDKGKHIEIKKKDGSYEFAIVHDEVSSISELLKEYDLNKHLVTVILNKKKHVDTLLKEWGNLVDYKHLTIVFVNPDAAHKKWVVKPHLHNQIADQNSLKKGIISMADAVELEA